MRVCFISKRTRRALPQRVHAAPRVQCGKHELVVAVLPIAGSHTMSVDKKSRYERRAMQYACSSDIAYKTSCIVFVLTIRICTLFSNRLRTTAWTYSAYHET